MYRYAALLDRVEGKDANDTPAELHGHPARPAHRRGAPRARRRPPHAVRPSQGAAALEAERAHPHRRRAPDARLLHDVGPAVRRSRRAPALRRDRLDRGAARHAVRVAHRSDRDLAREVAPARGDRGLQLLELRCRTRANPRIKAIWQRFLDYELGHLAYVRELFERIERRDAFEVLPATLPEPIKYESHREFVRETLAREVDLRASGDADRPAGGGVGGARSRTAAQLNGRGSPSETVARAGPGAGRRALGRRLAEAAAVH